MSGQSIPDEQKFFATKMSLQVFQEQDHFISIDVPCNASQEKLRLVAVRVGNDDSGKGELLP